MSYESKYRESTARPCGAVNNQNTDKAPQRYLHNLDKYWPVSIGGVCGETNDAGEVEPEWEAFRVSGVMRVCSD